MDKALAAFVDGIGAAAATSGVLNHLQGRIFALLYLHSEPLSLDEIARQLQQSKSNISVNIRGLVDWHLVRRVPVAGSRKDHYEAATDFWRLMREILETRYRLNVRQVLAAVEESMRATAPTTKAGKEHAAFVHARLDALRAFFTLLDAGIAAFTQGQAISAEHFRTAVPPSTPRAARGAIAASAARSSGRRSG